jgi:cytoskeletal protein CcmA (bactofilin family)
MIKFGRPDRIADPKPASRGALKPAFYDPPPASVPTPHRTTEPARVPAPLGPAPTATTPTMAAVTAAAASTPASSPGHSSRAGSPPAAEPSGSKLFVGVNIKLKGVEISDCDVLVIEGHVEATVHSKAMEVSKPGTLHGNAIIDIAEVHGTFSGELTARTRLVVHGTGRVSGKIRYGELVVHQGGEVSGDVAHLDAAEGAARSARVSASGTAIGAAAAASHSAH